MRIIVADCSAEYTGRLQATLPMARRVLLIKADNSLLIFFGTRLVQAAQLDSVAVHDHRHHARLR